MAAFSISAVTPADFDAWNPLWQGYLRFYETSVPDDQSRLTFSRFNDPAEPMGSFLAWNADGCAIGMVNWLTHRSTGSASDRVYLQDLFTVPEARGMGVGRTLIEAVYRKAEELGCHRVYWSTAETNETAQLLYDKVATRSGFTIYRQDF